MADSFINGGVDTELDQYIHGTPPNGWRRWMEDQVEQADIIICVFTEVYKRRWDGKEDPGKGLGATRESIILDQLLYEAGHLRSKVIPVIVEPQDKIHIPYVLRDMTHYVYERDFDDLYFYITKQPGVIKPKLGQVRQRQMQQPIVLPSASALPVQVSTPTPTGKVKGNSPQNLYISFAKEDQH